MVRKKVLLTGGSGQAGSQIIRCIPSWAEVIAPGRQDLDLSDPAAIARLVNELRPDAIINAAAFAAVDKAEAMPELARAINARAAGLLAQAASQVGARLVHISTDYVFDGRNCVPYLPTDVARPLSVYGSTKLEGELAIRASLPGEDYLILRTAWVHTPGHSNFVTAILRRLQDQAALGVVSDQIGTPTAAQDLAVAIWNAVGNDASGLVHFTNSGVASWFDFAVAIQRLAKSSGRVSNLCEISPISTAQYPTPARRPQFSVLDKTSGWAALDMTPVHWMDALERTWFSEGPA